MGAFATPPRSDVIASRKSAIDRLSSDDKNKVCSGIRTLSNRRNGKLHQ
jgi:hypothetical protein